MIPAIQNWLSGTGDYQSSFVYQTVKSHVSDEDEAKSYALRLLIHYLGDIHQPLHASARVDHSYPKGDAGGNFFKVPTIDQAKNLHSVWDSVVYLFSDTPQMPFSSSGWNKLGSSVSTMVSKNDIPESEWQNTDVELWAKESYELSANNVYNGIHEGQALPQDYIKKNQAAIQKQIVMGGLRLAYLIESIFSNN